MNLGDGLMFEIENGKPKLVFAHYGESKASDKVGFCQQVPQKIRSAKATSTCKQGLKEKERWQRDSKCRDSGGVSHAEHSSRKTRTKSGTGRCSVIGVVRVQPESKTKLTPDTPDVLEKNVKENLVCLTPEQLQQILNSIKASGQNVQEDTTTPIQNGAATKEEGTTTVAKDQPIKSEGKENETLSDPKPAAGLFSAFGEPEQKSDILKAKKAQWRRELDEQMALKKQQKDRAEVLAHCEQRRGIEATPGSGDQLLGVQEDQITQTGTEIPNNQPAAPQTLNNSKALPSAIRSAFVLGEAVPLEEVFSKDKKEQQRRWLQELEQQREETKMRRKLEKQSQKEAEDHERWAMHFDSFQRLHVPVQPTSTAEFDMGSSLLHHRAPSQALSTNTYGGDSVGRASTDNTQGIQPKSSYLRSMTALLDPAQLEERERRRVKQLEHQRAIEAQVEERRRQKEKEEAMRKAAEQEEERRIVRERERLQQEYLRDTQLQKQKEELQSRKTEQLYLSVQKASEEAQKDKHLQRIKDLKKKGHNVSNLLRTESISQAITDQGSESLATRDAQTEAPHTTRKDIAVQTVNLGSPSPETNKDFQAALEYKSPPNMKRSRRQGRLMEKNSGKENVCTPNNQADPYEAYARTDRAHGQQQPLRKPEWNIQRPRKAFVPASERYPVAMQKHRQENRMRRQMELMTLAERNTLSRTSQHAMPPRSENPSRLQRHSDSDHPNDDYSYGVQSASHRVPSPPVPAVKNRLQLLPPSCAEEQLESCGWPPPSNYVPYVRTDEVYHMDPLEPISRPTTQEGPQKIHTDVSSSSRQQTPAGQRDPLLHPELLKSTDRQQAILKGLSDLRQGLLQKQRELETSRAGYQH